MAKTVWRGGNMLYPVPAVMVSTADRDGRSNIITVAWAGTVCSNPPMVSISVMPRRFSHALLCDSREFVINLTSRKLQYACDWCGVRSGADVDKWQEMKLTPEPAATLSYAPLIAESPVNLECKVTKIEKLGSHDLFLAEITAVQVDDALLDTSGKLDLARADLTAYSHGEYYALGEKLGTFGYSVRKEKNARSAKSQRSGRRSK
ncbi:MAG TPA: flavin reductase family protein [Candidatus Coprovicinus avistercoris]|uniref:Flavin reductase family protein n=1 Tax=Candidatus Coprovicinus avistercoris TaxID=2840754 RepID=A0A9D1L542_9ACTN|nr:flavin reductase family protein [Candidatus Coprovicinus avistercoris]